HEVPVTQPERRMGGDPAGQAGDAFVSGLGGAGAHYCRDWTMSAVLNIERIKTTQPAICKAANSPASTNRQRLRRNRLPGLRQPKITSPNAMGAVTKVNGHTSNGTSVKVSASES